MVCRRGATLVVGLAAVAAALVSPNSLPTLSTHTSRIGCPAGTAAGEKSVAAIAAGRPTCSALGGPEAFTEQAANAAQLQARTTAPFATSAPGAYAAGLAQAERLPAAGTVPGSGNAWTLYGKSPECAAPSTQSSVCAANDSANGSYSQVGALGFRTLSGRVSSFAADPANPNRLWASPTAGGVWESDNGGSSWFSIGDGLPTQVVGAIAYDATFHRLLVGTGDNSFGGDGISGHGLFYSDSDGSSWAQAGGVPDLALSFRVVVSPADSSGRTVYLASSKGLFRSTDGGSSFVNENLQTTPPGYSPNCAGNTTTPLCFFANDVTDVVVKATGSANAPAGSVMAVVGWRAGAEADVNPDGTTNTSCRLNGSPTPCLQGPRNGLYISHTGVPGSFAYQDQGATQPTTQGFAPDPVVGRTALGIANGPGQSSDAVYAIVEDATKFQGCPDALDAGVNPVCNSTVVGLGIATYLDGMYATYDFGHSWTKILDYTQTKYPGTNSSIAALPGYSPGVQSWYNLWVQPDPSTHDASGHPTRVLFGLEEVWENNLTVPGVLSDPWQLHQTPAPGVAPWRVIGRYWNACSELNTGIPCNPDLKSNPIPGSTTHPDQHAVLFVPDRSGGGETLYVGSDGGVFKQHIAAGGDFSNDSWGDGQNIGLSSLQPYDAEMSKDGTVVSGLQDNGEEKTTPSGQEYEIYGGDAFFNTIDPDNSQNMIEEYTYGALAMTNDGGASWFPWGETNSCSSSTGLFSTPIEQDPTMRGHVVVGCGGVQEAVNAYANPCAVPPGAPASTCQLINIPFTTVFNLGNAPSGTPYVPSALAVRGANIYVGFCGYCDVVVGGLPFRSGLATNVGGSQPPAIGTGNGWHLLNPTCSGCGTPDGKLPQRYITSIQMDPANPKTVYLTMGGYGRRWIPPGALGDDTSHLGVGHLFVSYNGGQSFTNISGNLPDVPANWTLLHNGNLIVATDLGVYIDPPSALGQFSVLGTGLPRVPVFTLRADPGNANLLLISTYGRGDWTYRFPGSVSGTGSGHTGSSSGGGASTGGGSLANTGEQIGIPIGGLILLVGSLALYRRRRNIG
ncbi:MAG TPA: LPXTG cell wall anchor domain-containing protein [Mycobacteriales bacterium]|nr:LPXTG cell wall anchor domain-containing protein [Mycobacteriales bacterium]